MSRFLIFFGVVLALIGGVHLYFWLRLVRDTQLPFPYRPWASGALVLLAACLPLPFVLGRRLHPSVSQYFVWPAYIWMGFMFLLFVFLVGADLFRLATLISSKVGVTPELDPERRTFLARVLGGAAGLAAGLLGSVAVRQALAPLVVKDVVVRLPRLPAESHGTVIAQLTDVHIGPTIGRPFIEELVQKTNAVGADIIAITGDLVDGSVERLWHAVEPLGQLRARHGVYFVTGNHEYFSGVRPWMAALERLGIRVLRNERVAVGGFDLAGVHDYSGGRMDDEHVSDVERALAGRDPKREVVLLAHQPRSVVQAARLGVGLQLSGHTHGGQLWPWNYLVKLQQPYVEGLHRHGDTQIYVSPGTGYWGPPMRLGTRAEITRVVLHAG